MVLDLESEYVRKTTSTDLTYCSSNCIYSGISTNNLPTKGSLLPPACPYVTTSKERTTTGQLIDNVHPFLGACNPLICRLHSSLIRLFTIEQKTPLQTTSTSPSRKIDVANLFIARSNRVWTIKGHSWYTQVLVDCILIGEQKRANPCEQMGTCFHM